MADVKILMPDGSQVDPGESPHCRRCHAELTWKHLDDLGELNLELYGVLCWDCLAQAQKDTAENGY